MLVFASVSSGLLGTFEVRRWWSRSSVPSSVSISGMGAILSWDGRGDESNVHVVALRCAGGSSGGLELN